MRSIYSSVLSFQLPVYFWQYKMSISSRIPLLSGVPQFRGMQMHKYGMVLPKLGFRRFLKCILYVNKICTLADPVRIRQIYKKVQISCEITDPE
jgi:hypothetical protein